MKKDFDLLTHAYNSAKVVGQMLESPDGDWVPILFYITKDKEFHIAAVLSQEGLEEVEAQQVRDILRSSGAVEALMIKSAWTVTRDAESLSPDIRPSEEPDRMEVLVFSHVTQDKAEMAMAQIHRHPDKPPTLGEISSRAEGLNVQGRVIDSLRAGIG